MPRVFGCNTLSNGDVVAVALKNGNAAGIPNGSIISAASSIGTPPATATGIDSIALSTLLVAALVVLCGLVLSGAALPIWLQPTIVGILWGGTLLCGLFLGAWGMFRFSCVLTVAGLSILLHLACLRITNLQWGDSLLLTSILLSCGWFKGRWCSRELVIDPARCMAAVLHSQRRPLQWSIGDLATVTMLAACMISAGTQVRISPLLVSVAWAFLVGLMSCWTAYRWVWLDRWSMNSLGLAVLGIIAAIVYLDQYAPTDATWLESFAWLCAGPLSVVASQATTVLLFLAIVRFEQERQSI